MTDLMELEQRVIDLENEMKVQRRDTLRILGMQADTLNKLDELHARVVANELTAKANARKTEEGFSNVQAQIDGVQAQIDGLRSEVREVRIDVYALRRDLPGMLVQAIKEARD